MNLIRTKAPPYVRKLLKKYNDWDIRSLKICRAPLSAPIINALRLITLGKIDENLKNKDYDKLYHLYILIELGKGDIKKRFILEKNSVVNFSEIGSKKIKGTCMDINLPNVDFGTFYRNAENLQGKKFYLYDAKENNCQVFVSMFIIGNNLTCSSCGTREALMNFVLQDLDDLIIDPVWKLTRNITDFSAIVNRVLYGSGC